MSSWSHTGAERSRTFRPARRAQGVDELLGFPAGLARLPVAFAVLRGAVAYLPPDSPDLNPIEQLFSKLKALLRKAAARAREALWTAIGELLDAFPERECRDYLRNCGYEFT